MPTKGRIGYITHHGRPGVPNALENGTKSDVAHQGADWLHGPRRLRGGGGGPQCSRSGYKISSYMVRAL